MSREFAHPVSTGYALRAVMIARHPLLVYESSVTNLPGQVLTLEIIQ